MRRLGHVLIGLIAAVLLLAAGALAGAAAADQPGVRAACALPSGSNVYLANASGNLSTGGTTFWVSGCTTYPVEPGSNATVNVAVTNIGDSSGSTEVALAVNGTRTDSATVELDPGNTSRLDLIARLDETGTYKLNVTGAGAMKVAASEGNCGLYGYDADCNGEIEIGELGEAAADYVRGQITIQQLGTVASTYVSG